jgi:hypothetical protein
VLAAYRIEWQIRGSQMRKRGPSMTQAWKDELPVSELPDDPRWRENFCFDGYDKDRDVGFWIHCGRWSLDPRIWREQVLLYLPGGDYLVHRAWGFRPSDNGPRSALLDLVCNEPQKRWTIRYRGPARLTNQDEVQAGLLLEGDQLLLDLDIGFSTERPIWDMTAGIRDQTWGKFHTEQTGRFKGSIRYGDKATAMDGLGWHDHSRGARDLVEQGRHLWIHGDISRDRSFALTMIDNYRDGTFVRVLDKVIVWDDNKIYPARCPDPPVLESSDLPPTHYQMRLEYEKGTVLIRAEQRRKLPHSTTRDFEVFDGRAPAGMAQVVTYEGGTVFFVDGEELNGHSERSYRL